MESFAKGGIDSLEAYRFNFESRGQQLNSGLWVISVLFDQISVYYISYSKKLHI